MREFQGTDDYLTSPELRDAHHLKALMDEARAGQVVECGVRRDGTDLQVRVVLTARP